jgi:hypothetical protein
MAGQEKERLSSYSKGLNAHLDLAICMRRSSCRQVNYSSCTSWIWRAYANLEISLPEDQAQLEAAPCNTPHT